jgi:cytochrome P450
MIMPITTALDATRDQADVLPLDEINVADAQLWRDDVVWPLLDRLRREDPVHLHPAHHHPDGPFWSVTRYNDIIAVDTDHQTFSSEPTIFLEDQLEEFNLPAFIQMDPPRHHAQRKTVSPIVSPSSLAGMEGLIRSRIQTTLDSLPIGEPFDWVDLVSIELTGQMLATLFDFPFEDRRKLTYWSDVATADPVLSGMYANPEQFQHEFIATMTECAEYFTRLWNERVNQPPRGDLISMLAHGESTRNMDPQEFLGNLLLLIIGGNDTTRNTMSGSVLAMFQNPGERSKLDADPGLIPSMVSETLRWQTPLSYMRRTATRDVELGGKTIRKGDKVVMWYASGNRDETVIERPYDYWIDRPNVRRHLAFGFGIHRCLGNRLAELQLRILWEEVLQRFPAIEVESVERVPSAFVHGYAAMQVTIPCRL